MTNSIAPPQLKQLEVLSSQQLGWNDILVEQYQTPSNHCCEQSTSALSTHWLSFPSTQPIYLTQQHGDRLHESIVQKGDLVLIPAGQPTYWRAQVDDIPLSNLSIYLQPELIARVVEASEIDGDRIDLMDCFSQYDLHLHQIATMLLTELKLDGIMGKLYVESLTQILVIHLLKHYSGLRPITVTRSSLTHTRLQQSIDYIHAHLDCNLSLVQIAKSSNTSPIHFAYLFKQFTGISLHQYVIKQRVERVKLLLTTTSVPIDKIATQVGFNSQSHLTQHCKRLTGMTPKKLR